MPTSAALWRNTPRTSNTERGAASRRCGLEARALRSFSLLALFLASSSMRRSYRERRFAKTINLYVIHFYIVFLGSFDEVCLVSVLYN